MARQHAKAMRGQGHSLVTCMAREKLHLMSGASKLVQPMKPPNLRRSSSQSAVKEGHP